MRQGMRVTAAVGTFFGLVWAISALFYFFIIYCGHVGGGRGVFVLGLMWSPGVAALLTTAIHGRRVSDLGWAWGRTRYQLLSYAIPLAYATVAYAVAWTSGLGGFGNPEFVSGIAKDYGWTAWPAPAIAAGYVLLQATVGLILGCAYALGEEIGWRGFLVPELARTLSFTQLSIVSGVVWATWHYPLLLFADYNSGTPSWYGVTCFTIMVIGISFAFAWMRLRSGSLWTGMILHGSHNLYVQTVFDPFTADTGRTKFVTGEFGAALAIAAVGTAVIVWRARRAVDVGSTGVRSEGTAQPVEVVAQ
jgi:membrane protease YdiL (CAAX protease family)